MTAQAPVDTVAELDLRIFTVDEAVEAVRRRYEEIAAGIATTPAVFREPGGHYWLAARTGWQRDDGAGAAGGPTSVLEGPAELDWPRPNAHEDGPMPAPGIDQVAAEIARLRADYSVGRLTSGELAASLGQVVLADADGQRWTIGYVSGARYRFAQGAWVASRSEPIEPAAGGDAESRRDVCPACGSAELGKRFCGDCGAEVLAGKGVTVASNPPPGLVDYFEHGLGTIPERPVAPWSPPPPPVAASPSSAPSVPVAATPHATRSRPSGRGVIGTLSVLRSLTSLVIGLGILLGSVAGIGPFAPGPVNGGGGAGSGSGTGVIAPSLAVVAPSLAIVASATVAVAPPTVAVVPPAPIVTAAPVTLAPAGTVIFEDDFTSPGIWPSGGKGLTASYASDGFILQPHPADDPTFIWAPNESTVGKAVTIEASLRFQTGSVAAVGVAMADAADGTRLFLIVDATGSWAIGRDTSKARDLLANGSVGVLATDVDHLVTLELTGSGTLSARLDGQDLGKAKGSLTVGLFGLVTWTQASDRIAVHHYLVTAP